MGPEQKKAALLAEIEALKAKSLTDDFTDDDAARSLEAVKELADVEKIIARKEAASKALGGVTAPVQESADDTPSATGAAKSGSLGQQFVNSDAYKAFKTANPKPVEKDTPISIKATGLKIMRRKLLDTATTGNAEPVMLDGIEDVTFRPPRRLLEVITRGTTNREWVKYRQVVSKTNNAAIVAEASDSGDPVANTTTGVLEYPAGAGLKPLSTLTTQTAEAKAATYADGMEVTNQELSDDGIISSLIDSTLTENIEITIEDMILNGDSGTDPEQPDGIFNTTGVLQQAFVTDAVTSIRKAITLLRTTSGASIRGVLLNPQDDEAWDLLQDANNRYYGAGPFGSGPRTAWGYERIESQAIPVGQAVIGDFSTIHFLIYEALSVLAFNQHKDFAQRNLTYIRAEMRAMQMIRNAAKLCVVDLTA
ncbi:phage major capsid protein [Demequina capsici]|uniref:Phage major capsid protein n=1 Tax=Demequina capsici TaxID=3075620 RepID=A0AA96FDR2_9MICO|nr:phage major capsid protein [Demequina sp. PMTSA13]WNM27547.1 phage major capsid protein [Demequina sp. PMTSA13]